MQRSLSVLAAAALTAALGAQVIQAPFDQSYSFRSLGQVPGVPTPYGGVTFKFDDPDVLLIGGSANSSVGALFAIRVTRAPNGSITGFQGTAQQVSTAAYNDGGLQYGPSNVLFYARYPLVEIGQIKPASTAPDRAIALSPLGWIGGSPGALSFVPPGFPGAGRLKICAYSGGAWHDCAVAPDGNGTFDLVGLQPVLNLNGGPEGILYPPPGSPLLPDYARVIVTEYSAGTISVYDIDANGDPVVATRQPFMTGLSGAEGATIDSQTGSFVFSTFGGNNQVLVVEGFGTCGNFVGYGTGIPGSNGLSPAIRGTGCATFNQAIAFQVGSGPSRAIGAMNIGFQRLQVPIFGGFVLTDPAIPLPHILDAQGSWTTTISTPNDPNLVGRSIYFQSAYIDPPATFGLTASDGLEMRIR
jgi:hypothetical protein